MESCSPPRTKSCCLQELEATASRLFKPPAPSSFPATRFLISLLPFTEVAAVLPPAACRPSLEAWCQHPRPQLCFPCAAHVPPVPAACPPVCKGGTSPLPSPRKKCPELRFYSMQKYLPGIQKKNKQIKILWEGTEGSLFETSKPLLTDTQRQRCLTQHRTRRKCFSTWTLCGGSFLMESQQTALNYAGAIGLSNKACPMKYNEVVSGTAKDFIYIFICSKENQTVLPRAFSARGSSLPTPHCGHICCTVSSRDRQRAAAGRITSGRTATRSQATKHF